jgi:hypothetical protein
MIYQYRLTKYSPEKRDQAGNYLEDEWTSFSDIGKTFDNKVFMEKEYYQVEDAYISVIMSFLDEAGIDKLSLTYLENTQGYQEPKLKIQVGREYTLQEVERLFRLVLREAIWGKFEGQSKAYVHFGWDYHMYLGLPVHCPNALSYAKEKSLFVEPFVSPYLDVEEV